MTHLPSKLAERIEKSAPELKESYHSSGDHWEAVVAYSAFKNGAHFAATEILKEVEKLLYVLDMYRGYDEDLGKSVSPARDALSAWHSFIGQKVVE
jgi:hypothetical protein